MRETMTMNSSAHGVVFASTRKTDSLLRLALSVLGLTALSAGNLLATTVVSDTFSDGSTAKTGSLDLAYYSSAAGNISVISDAVLDPDSANSNRVLKLNADRSAIASLGQTLALTNGTSITLSFNYRFTTVTPGTSGNTLRFGLFNDNGTAVTTNDLTPSNDDYGFWSSFSSTSTAASIGYVYETGTNGGITSGTDRTYSSTTAYAFDTNAHSVSMTFTLVGTSYTVITSVDGTPYGSYTTSAPTSFNPNEFVLVSLVNSVEIDNLAVSTVPEPQTWALLIGALCLLGNLHRKRSQS